MAGKVLVLDDEKNISFVVQAMLERDGIHTTVMNDSAEALDALDSDETRDINAVITDLYMPGPSGMAILDFCQRFRPELPVVIMTAYGTVEAAVSALKQGAFDFVTNLNNTYQTRLLQLHTEIKKINDKRVQVVPETKIKSAEELLIKL
ncbi:MAG: response regulator [Bdellovibrionota bacterium]